METQSSDEYSYTGYGQLPQQYVSLNSPKIGQKSTSERHNKLLSSLRRTQEFRQIPTHGNIQGYVVPNTVLGEWYCERRLSIQDDSILLKAVSQNKVISPRFEPAAKRYRRQSCQLYAWGGETGLTLRTLAITSGFKPAATRIRNLKIRLQRAQVRLTYLLSQLKSIRRRQMALYIQRGSVYPGLKRSSVTINRGQKRFVTDEISKLASKENIDLDFLVDLFNSPVVFQTEKSNVKVNPFSRASVFVTQQSLLKDKKQNTQLTVNNRDVSEKSDESSERSITKSQLESSQINNNNCKNDDNSQTKQNKGGSAMMIFNIYNSYLNKNAVPVAAKKNDQNQKNEVIRKKAKQMILIRRVFHRHFGSQVSENISQYIGSKSPSSMQAERVAISPEQLEKRVDTISELAKKQQQKIPNSNRFQKSFDTSFQRSDKYKFKFWKPLKSDYSLKRNLTIDDGFSVQRKTINSQETQEDFFLQSSSSKNVNNRTTYTTDSQLPVLTVPSTTTDTTRILKLTGIQSLVDDNSKRNFFATSSQPFYRKHSLQQPINQLIKKRLVSKIIEQESVLSSTKPIKNNYYFAAPVVGKNNSLKKLLNQTCTEQSRRPSFKASSRTIKYFQ